MGRRGALVLSLLATFGLFAPGNYARAADPVFCGRQGGQARQAAQMRLPEQIATNIANKFGFTGLRWLDDKQAHFDWCSKMNPGMNAMQNEIKIRKNMLKGC